MADRRMKEYVSPLYKKYEHRKKTIQDALDRLSAHSTAGYAIVMVINTAVMLFKATLAIEFYYHFRPYHWKIMNSLAYIMSLGLVFIGRGTFFICSVISLALLVILQFLWLACYGLAKFTVMLITYLILAIVYTVSFLLHIAFHAIIGFARVSRFLITTLPIMVINLGTNYWKSLTFRVIISIVVISLSILLWRRYKREKLNRNDSDAGAFLFDFRYFDVTIIHLWFS